MSVSLLTLVLAAAPCTPSEALTLSLKEGATLESVADWSSKHLCLTTTLDPNVGKGATLKVGVSGKVNSYEARTMLVAALSVSGLVLVSEGGALRIARPAPGSPEDKTCEVAARALRVVSDNERVVSRAIFESEWTQCTVASARVVPSMRDGKLDGLKLFAIRPTSVWAAAGFQNGDTVREVNGLPLLEPEQVLDAVAKLRHASRLEFVLERRGEPWRVIITVEPDPKK